MAERRLEVEFVTFDPDDHETYPSVCVHPSEVEERFGFTGGETLIFTATGAYIGQVVKMLGDGTPVVR